VWGAPSHVLTLAHRDSLLDNLLGELVRCGNHYDTRWKRVRVTLGPISLLALPQKPPPVMKMMLELFTAAMGLVRKSAEERIASQVLVVVKRESEPSDEE
jgi:hypothetical protein